MTSQTLKEYKGLLRKEQRIKKNKRAKSIQAALLDFNYFTEEYVPLDKPDGEHHKEWKDIVSRDDIDRCIILAPREHGKSTIFSENYPLWEIIKNPNVRILLVSNTHSNAQSFLRVITHYLEYNEKLIRDFGNLKPEQPDKWTDSQILVNRSKKAMKDSTVSVVGTGSAVRMKRADVIICDDILDDSNTGTPEQRVKTKMWFNDTLVPVLTPEGKIIVIGTLFNKADLYSDLLKNPVYNFKKIYRAITNKDKKEVLWPEKWSHEQLQKKKKEVGKIAFARQYMNEIRATEECPFNERDIDKAKDVNRKLLRSYDGDMLTVQGWDLAISKKEGSSYTAGATLGLMDNGTRVLLGLFRKKLTAGETRAIIKEEWQNFEAEKIKVESVAYQRSLVNDLIEETSLPVEGYSTGGEKFDEEIGINSLAILFENKKFILPYSPDDPRTIELVDILLEGMMSFPSGHTEDLLMAVWFANQALRDIEADRTKGQVRKIRVKGFYDRR